MTIQTKNNDNFLSFEKILNNLQQVVKKMETGELSLEKSIEEYEKGINLIRKGQSRLSEMEGKIEILMKNGDVKEVEQSDINK